MAGEEDKSIGWDGGEDDLPNLPPPNFLDFPTAPRKWLNAFLEELKAGAAGQLPLNFTPEDDDLGGTGVKIKLNPEPDRKSEDIPMVDDVLDLKIGRYNIKRVGRDGIVVQGKGSTTGERLIPYEDLVATGEEISIQGERSGHRAVWRLKKEKALASYPRA